MKIIICITVNIALLLLYKHNYITMYDNTSIDNTIIIIYTKYNLLQTIMKSKVEDLDSWRCRGYKIFENGLKRQRP